MRGGSGVVGGAAGVAADAAPTERHPERQRARGAARVAETADRGSHFVLPYKF